MPRAVLGTGDGAVRPRPGPVPVVLPAGGESVPLAGRARGVGPVPGGQGAWRWLLPGGRRGLSAAALARARGGRIKVIVAWQRARRLRRPCRRHQQPPGDAGQMPRCPGPAPSRIRRWCTHRVPVDARNRVRAGCDTWPGTRRPPGFPLPAAGSGHATGAAVTCAFTAMARIWRWLPRASSELPAWPGGAGAGGLPVPCGQPLVPTDIQDQFEYFRM